MILYRKDAYISSTEGATATRTDSGRLSRIDDLEETISSEVVYVFFKVWCLALFFIEQEQILSVVLPNRVLH